MKDFAQLFQKIDQTTSTKAKVSALAAYFETAPEEDRLWTIALFSGRRPKRTVTVTQLREWAAELAGIPQWLFEESYPIVGDLAETISLILPEPSSRADATLATQINEIRDLAKVSDDEKKTSILGAWDRFATAERFVFNKLITGGFRVGISQKLMTRALAKATGKPEPELAHRLMGNWHPDDTSWHALIEAADASADASRPYPFYLAYALEEGPEGLGDTGAWRIGDAHVPGFPRPDESRHAEHRVAAERAGVHELVVDPPVDHVHPLEPGDRAHVDAFVVAHDEIAALRSDDVIGG